MRRIVLITIVLALWMARCSDHSHNGNAPGQHAAGLPKVLFITTGISGSENRPAQGIILAAQFFNIYGAIVRLEPRDILYDSLELSRYNIIILSTFDGVHDADRKYSLSYMSDEEIHNLVSFVSRGGILVSADNVARNYPDGTDRISVFGELKPENWELSACFGVTFSEADVTRLGLQGEVPGKFRWEALISSIISEGEGLWTIVPGKALTGNRKILARWNNEHDSTGAMIENQFGKGLALYLPLSALLQPDNGGGLWSSDQIGRFYKYVIGRYNEIHGIKASLNPWPSGHDHAFCVSLNADGNLDHYERVFSLLEKEKIQPVIFVNGLVKEDIRAYLINKAAHLASNGFSYSDFSDLKYPQAVDDILRNENHWNMDFHGFRFPYTRPEYWGLLALDEHGYTFESSIGANNIDFFHGSVVPYNLVMAGGGFYISSDLLEIAPTYHDDYHFLEFLSGSSNPDSLQLEKSVSVYGKYLENYWQYAVKPYKGLMVFLGHPRYVGYNDFTMKPLGDLIHLVRADNAWVTSLEEAASYRQTLSEMQFFVSNDPGETHITVKAPAGVMLKDVCLNYPGHIKSAAALKGRVRSEKHAGMTQLIFDASDGEVINISE